MGLFDNLVFLKLKMSVVAPPPPPTHPTGRAKTEPGPVKEQTRTVQNGSEVDLLPRIHACSLARGRSGLHHDTTTTMSDCCSAPPVGLHI